MSTKLVMDLSLGGIALRLKREKNASVIVDQSVANLYPKIFQELSSDQIFLLPSGEAAKTWKNLEKILLWLAKQQKERSQKIIAVGGGAVCDVVALAASLYRRGAPLILIPTTMLAQIDAAVGGKTAIDLVDAQGTIKNFAGTFYPAEEIWISMDFLCTLPLRERKSGAGELLKMCWLYGKKIKAEPLRAWITESRIHQDLWKAMKFSISAKAKVVRKDPYDTKRIREALNFGHTVGHALESVALGELSHGEAIVWGMWVETKFLRMKFSTHIGEVIEQMDFQLPEILAETKAQTYLARLQKDKKMKKGFLEITVASNPGKRVAKKIKAEALAQFCEKSFSLL